MRRRRRDTRKTPYTDDDDPIDIIPLIDVMFLLLCFFIFLTLAMVVQEGIAVDLAQAKSGEPVASQQEPLVVSVKEDGSIFLNKDEIPEDKLTERLRSYADKNPDRPVHLNADEAANHSQVVTALDAIRQSELSNLVFTIKPEN